MALSVECGFSRVVTVHPASRALTACLLRPAPAACTCVPAHAALPRIVLADDAPRPLLHRQRCGPGLVDVLGGEVLWRRGSP